MGACEGNKGILYNGALVWPHEWFHFRYRGRVETLEKVVCFCCWCGVVMNDSGYSILRKHSFLCVHVFLRTPQYSVCKLVSRVYS